MKRDSVEDRRGGESLVRGLGEKGSPSLRWKGGGSRGFNNS